MIHTGDEYRDFIRGGREFYVNGEKVADVAWHPQFSRWSLKLSCRSIATFDVSESVASAKNPGMPEKDPKKCQLKK
ncbi:MAG: hypothetical protein OEU36_01690 [Gammaproteobacteria bacterium]|nr:hypothetical protein [Gammaproteobacteria bacterium]